MENFNGEIKVRITEELSTAADVNCVSVVYVQYVQCYSIAFETNEMVSMQNAPHSAKNRQTHSRKCACVKVRRCLEFPRIVSETDVTSMWKLHRVTDTTLPLSLCIYICVYIYIYNSLETTLI
jgi:hypothetical protein